VFLFVVTAFDVASKPHSTKDTASGYDVCDAYKVDSDIHKNS
jgi:hypothetical protein